MMFDAVVAALQAERPNAEIGLTVSQGQYHRRAVEMTFRRVTPIVYRADGGGHPMWLYVNDRFHGGRICCGNKRWDEMERLG